MKSFGAVSRMALGVFIIISISMKTVAEPAQNKGPWLTSIEEVVTDILAPLSEDQQEILRKTSKTTLYYEGFGVGIRIRYGLWKGNNALVLSACGYLCHPNEASMKIIEALWDRLNQPPEFLSQSVTF